MQLPNIYYLLTMKSKEKEEGVDDFSLQCYHFILQKL